MQKFLKSSFLFFLVLIVLGMYLVLNIFQKASLVLGKPQDYLLNTISLVNKNNPYQNKEKINFIILGLDKRDDLLEKTQTTDTIMFVSLNLKNQKINIISIPRDLWFYQINSKINEIYPLSLSESNPLSFIKDKYQNLTNQPIDHVVVLTTDNLIKFVNLIGGVDVNLDTGFIDKEYPNPEYIKNPNSSISKYKTVEFKSGINHLDETNITEFVRSRKSSDSVLNGGTDLARIQRQQVLLESILNKIKKGDFVTNNLDPIALYNFWDNEIIKDLSDLDILNILSILDKDIEKLTLNKINLPLGTNPKNGVYYHPKSFINKQWVFIPSDKNYQAFQKYISDSI